MLNDNHINFIGETTFRNQKRKFGIKTDDRRRHVYIVGKTGMGKTELLKNMAIQDIKAGNGLAFVDPHGETAEDLLNFVPKERFKDVVYFDPSDVDYPIAFNVMENVDPTKRNIVASGLMDVFKKIWPDVWSARMEYILNNAILALLEYPNSTLLGINRMLADNIYREKVLREVKDPVIKTFWTQEFARYTQRYEVEATAAIENKIGQFISNPLVRNIVGQVRSSIHMREIMDGRKILLLNLSKGKIGEDNSRLLGSLLITKIQLAAMSRVNTPEEKRPDFYLYVDEFQNFATESFVNILSEARKYHLCLTLAHQYIAQMEDVVREAVFGNVGTIIAFRVGAEDAEFLEPEFAPIFTAEDFVNLPKYNVYIKLMIDGIAGNPFSAVTLPPYERTGPSFKKQIIQHCREEYAVKKSVVESKINHWVKANNRTTFHEKTTSSNTNKFISLDKVLGKKSIPFVAPKEPFEEGEEKPIKKKVRKQVDLEGLKNILKKTLRIQEEKNREANQNENGGEQIEKKGEPPKSVNENKSTDNSKEGELAKKESEEKKEEQREKNKQSEEKKESSNQHGPRRGTIEPGQVVKF